MLLTESQYEVQQPLASSLDRIRLRIHGDRVAGQLLELPPGKTSIGSSPRCNIRIQEPGVHPLQCLISLESGSFAVRRWAPDTLLNGEPFDDAPLAVGDILSLGPVDLEIVGAGLANPEAPTVSLRESPPPIAPIGEETHAGVVGEGTSGVESVENGFNPAESVPQTWDSSTVHHTTVWLGDDEPSVASNSDAPDAQACEPARLAEVVSAEGAREVFRQLQEANALARGRCRKLLGAIRRERDDFGHRSREAEDRYTAEVGRLTDQINELAQSNAQLVDEKESLGREIPMLRQQLETAHERYTEWDHQSNEWEKQRTEWTAEREQWDRERSDWTEQLGEWKTRLAGHLRRIEELEEQLRAAQCAESSSVAAEAEPVASALVESPPDDESQESLWSNQIEVASESSGLDAAGSEHAEAEAPICPSETPTEPPAWDRQPPNGETECPAEQVSPENNSIAEDLPNAPCEDATPDAPAERFAADASPADPNSPPSSYLERFAHLFKEEDAAVEAPPHAQHVIAAESSFDQPRDGRVAPSNGALTAASSGEVEESIEQYMTKLMQRVRGEQFMPSALSYSARTNGSATATVPIVSPSPTPADKPTHECDEKPFEDLSELVRKGPAPERPANLDALRALANETAHRAIGVHATQKCRRDAVSKFLVASLAGITSVLLMMLAPSWYDLQFISACVSLMIAAYWAGQTYGTLLEMVSAGEYDGPETPAKAERKPIAPESPCGGECVQPPQAESQELSSENLASRFIRFSTLRATLSKLRSRLSTLVSRKS